MGWELPRRNLLAVSLLPVLFVFFLLGTADLSNQSNYTTVIAENGQHFTTAEEFLSAENATQNTTNQSEFIGVEEFLNTTKETTETHPIPTQNQSPREQPPANISLNLTTQPTELNNTTPNDSGFQEVEGFLNISGEGQNKTQEEFAPVEEYLNITDGQTKMPEAPSAGKNFSAQDTLFKMKDSAGRTTNATFYIFEEGTGKQIEPERSSRAGTPFGVSPGKYDLKVIPGKPDAKSKEGKIQVPVKEVLLKSVKIDAGTNPELRIQGIPPSATPFGKNTKQAFAIDPTDFEFTEGEITMVSRGSELYKCAKWNYPKESCEGKWVKIQYLTPGEEFTIKISPDDPAYAVYNATYGAPECSNYTSPCIANSSLLYSRDSLGTPEPNQPNTIDGCTDGTAGTYQVDESVENITIESLTLPYDTFNEGDLVRVNTTVYCWSTGASDNINLVYTSDASNPIWSVVNSTDPCPGGGFQDLSGTFTLANTPGPHAVRVINQYNGDTTDTCGTGAYDDSDDLVFQVNGTPPTVNLVSPAEDALVCEGIAPFTFNVTDASSCTLYIDGVQDRPITISAAADTNYHFNASVIAGSHNWSVSCGAIDSEVRNFTQCPSTEVYGDTFTSSGGLSPDGTNSAPWERGDATQVGTCHRDASCWGTGLSSNYDANGPYDDLLEKSTSMDLSSYANVTLVFYHYRYFEDAATLYDAGVVEVNNGTGWTRLTPEGGYSGTVDNGYGNSLGNQQAYGNHGPGWELEVFNLTNYSGQDNVTFHFYFAADNSVNDRGWFIDDVKVFGDPVVDYGIISVWDTSDTETVPPGENNTFYANYSYLNETPISGPAGTCNITTNETFQMSYNSATGIYEFNQSFPSSTSGTFIVECQKNSSFIPDSKSGDYIIKNLDLTNLTCWEFQDPVTPAYPGSYNQMFLFCNYSYLNDTPVNSDGVCSWQDDTYIDYYFFGQENFNQRDISFFGQTQYLYSFGGVWAELNASRGQGKVTCYNETQGTMVVHMCLDYLNTSQDTNNNLNNSNESANCFPVGTMTCDQFSGMAGVPKGTFSWVSMDLNMTEFYNTWNTVGSPYLVDMQFTYECPNCSYSLYTTPYNVSEYGTDLVALYRFDEFVDNGTANVSVDAAGNLNLTKSGTVGIAPGQVNKSFNFSSAPGYIYAPDVTGFDVLSQVTAEAYLKLEYDSPKERVILSKWAYSPSYSCGQDMDQLCLEQRSTRMYLDKEGHLNVQFSHNGQTSGTVTVRDPEKFPVGEWAHAGFVFNGTTIRLYRNSLIVAQSTDFSGYKIYDGTAPWVVGADDAGNHGYAEGMQIDELRVIKRGLEDWEFVSHANADFWLIKSQSIPESYHTYISSSVSGNKRNFTRSQDTSGENLVKLSVLGNALNMSFNSTTGLYTGHRAVPYGFHPGTYTINYSCSKPTAEPQSLLSDWQVYSSAPNCSIDGYLSSIPLGSYQYVNWSVNSNTPPLEAYYNITHSDGHVYSYYNTKLTNGSTYVNHAQGVAEITCYVRNGNSSYSSTKEFNITGPEHCFYATGPNSVYTLASDLNSTKEDSACITVEADNITIDCAGHSVTGEGTGYGFRVYGNNETTLKNCNITSYNHAVQWINSNHGGIRNNTLSNNSNGIFMDPSYNNTIIQNQVFNNSANGLYLYDSHNNTLRNNSAYNNSQDGFLLWGSTYNNLTNNTAYENGRWGFTIYLDSDYNTLLDNSAYNNSQDGFTLWDGSYNTLEENKAFNNTRHGIIAYLNSSNNNFTENQAYENSQNGIYLYDYSGYNRLYNNTAYLNSNVGFALFNSSNNTLADNIAYQNWIGYYLQRSHENLLQGEIARFNYNNGFYLYYSNSSTFDSCYGYNNSANGFLVEDYSYKNLIKDSHAFNNSGNGFVLRDSSCCNNLTGSYAHDNSWWGVRIFNGATGIYLMHNEISNNSRDGLRIESGSNNATIINNTILNNSWNGANITGCNYTSFSSGNNVSNNTVFGIYFNNSHHLTVNGSHINGNGDDGLSGRNSDNANISSNIAIENSGDEIFLTYSTASYIGYNTLGESINPYLVTDDPTNHTLYGQLGGPASDSIDIPYNHNGTVIGNNGSNTYAGVRCDGCTNMSITRNNFTGVVFGVGSSNMSDTNATFNYVSSGSSAGFYLVMDVRNNNFSSNTLLNCSHHGIYLDSGAGYGCTNNTFTNNTVYNNSPNGIHIRANDNTFTLNTISSSGTSAIYMWNASGTQLHNNRIYDNPSGFYARNTGAAPYTYNMTGTLFLPASGALQNYTNLSIYDSLEASASYTVNWSGYAGTPGVGYNLFAGKVLDISIVSGTPSINELSWHWNDSGGYTESDFELWKHNSSGWNLLNDTPDTANNLFSYYSLDPASDYGIYENSGFCNLTCWFDPQYQEPTGLRNVWCNLTNESGDPITGATISHETYDVNDWYLNGATSEKGWIYGYKRITNLTATNYTVATTYRITNESSAHIRYGGFYFPFPHVSQEFNIMAKAGSNASLLRLHVCNNSYSDSVFGNTPGYFTLPSQYPGCQFAGTINATEFGANTQNWTWVSLNVTSAYNNVTENMSGIQNYSIHLSSTDKFVINPVGWEIPPQWMPPLYNNTIEAYRMLNSTYDYEEGSESGLPSGGGYDPAYGINMSGNVGLWKLDEAAGTNIEDYSGEGNNGTISGTQYTLGVTPSPQNKSINFNNSYGTGQYGEDRIVVPHDSSLTMNTEGSVCAWAKVNSAEQWQGIVHKGNLSDFSNAEYALQMLSNGLQPSFVITDTSTANVYPTGAANLELDRWYHLCGTFNSSTVAIWVDGELEDTTANTIGTPRQSTGTLQIGAQLTEDLNSAYKKIGFNGKIDEVAIFNRSLSAQEIQQMFRKGSKKLLPDNRTHNATDVEFGKHYILMAGTLGFDSSTDYTLFDEDDDYGDFQNLSSFESVRNSSFTQCFFFQRSRLSNNDEILYSMGTALNLRLINDSGSYEVEMNVRRTGSAGVTTLQSSSGQAGDYDWHHVCARRNKADATLALIFDGAKVQETSFDNNYQLESISQVVFGRDLDTNGAGNNFRGQIAQFHLLNASVASASILNGINNAFWELAISDEQEPGVFAEGNVHNSTSIYWEREPEATPVAYVRLIDRNRNMTYNSTGSDTLYHAYYHTNRAEYAASLGSAGANFTTFFNATKDGSTFCNDTQYWYVRAASNSSCTIHNYNWTNTSKTGQYQDWFINWSVNSSVPVNAQGLVVCSPSGFCHTYDTPGVTQIEENYEYGTHEFYCFSQNDYDTEQYNSSNETFDVGCWSAYDDYDGSKSPLIMQSDVYICPGFHTAIPQNNSYVIVNDGNYRLNLLGPTTVDGGGVRYGTGQWGTLYWAYNLSNRVFDAQGYLTVQNGEIAFYTDKYVHNYTFAGVNFINMSIGYDLEHTDASDFYVFNNTFDGCGMGLEDAIYVTGPNVQIIGNNFTNPAPTHDTNIYCDGCTNVTLEQNYYWDIGNLEIYTNGIPRTVSTPAGNITCTPGISGPQHPYANYSMLLGTNYTNGADLFGEIADFYPCTDKQMGCRVINSSGNHTLYYNVTGAPLAVSGPPDVTKGCIIIEADDVDFSCNGYHITNNGTPDAVAILVNGSDSTNYTNVTIRDCPSISLYEKGAYLYNSSEDTIRNVTAHNNTEAGIKVGPGSNNTLSGNNVSGNTANGFYFTSDSFSNNLTSNRVCFNGAQDLYNLNGTNFGTLDTCNSWNLWSEFSHPGCAFRCTDIWHYFFGDVSGEMLLAPTQSDIFYSWNWSGQSGKVYVVSSNSSVEWSSLIALGRNTSLQNSTDDFTELDSALSISSEQDNINATYSYDGSNPIETRNWTLFEHYVPYLPVANSTVFNNGFYTGISWDSSQGGLQFNTSLNQDVVFTSQLNGSSTYDYEIRVPETLATYKGGNTVEFWVELD